MDTNYYPKPIDTSAVKKSPEIESLIERLAANAHDVWAEKRVAEGWTFGTEKDPAIKATPFLVPYAALPESEKETDRVVVRGTIEAAAALGWRIESPIGESGSLDPAAAADLKTWEENLGRELSDASEGGARSLTFDMDDKPEMASLKPDHFPRLKAAFQHLQDTVFREWQRADADALRLQKKHRLVALLAIWPGTLAIICAILQLWSERILPEAMSILGLMEITAVAIAGVAVALGLWLHLHHGWLAHRQRAERLRVLKFHSLSWPELWCDFDAWKARVQREVSTLCSLTSHEAKAWAMEQDIVRPELPSPPGCAVPPADFRALATPYGVKRLQFQQRYFDFQSRKAGHRSWIVDRKIAVWVFGLSVFVVLIHGMHLIHHAGVEICLIALAALLPVLGFGFRAWIAAFEAPRSRNLYRAKARALDAFIERNRADATDIMRTFQHIAHGEYFFANEHREWCRLQMEAEWFV